VGSSPRNHRTGTTARERSSRAVAGARSIEHAARQGLRMARRIEEPRNDSSTSPEGEVLLIESVKLWWVTVRPREIRTAESYHS
jgi:hypothetical protein